MDVFALQEELDSVRVQRRTRRDDRPSALGSSNRKLTSPNTVGDHGDDEGVADLVGMSSFASEIGEPGSPSYPVTDSFALQPSQVSESEIIACLHPLSAEYALRAKYTLVSHQIIGKGAYGEVVIGKLKEHYQPLQSSSPSGGAHANGCGGAGGSNSSSSPSSSPMLRRAGSFSVDRLSASFQQQFAIKRIDKRCINPKSLNQLYGEVETLSLLSHNNVVRLQEVFQDDDFLWIVMEYVKGGELAKVLKRAGRLTENVARKVAMSLLFGVEYIHEKGIVHRDLKPANCLLTKLPAFMKDSGEPAATAIGGGGGAATTATTTGDVSPTLVPAAGKGSKPPRRNRPEDFSEEDFGNLKIADFGFAALVGRAECLTNFCGTQHYMAPEVIRRDGLNYGKAVDVWSFGVILYLILSGEYPFSSTEQICHGKVQFLNTDANDHVWARISPQAKDFILKLLVVDPTKRPSATEALRHPWIKFEYSDSGEVSDYPTTKGIWREHSKWVKTRKFEHRFSGAAQAVIFAHRLVFLARLQAMRREGIADISMLRHFPYIVHGVFEPTNHVAASGRRFVGNVAALRRLADMVGASLTVEVFDVSNSSIDDLSLVQHIVKVAYTHPSLICLNLENNPIPPLAGRALIRLARSLTHKLSVINVNNTNLGYDTIAQVDMCLKETIRKRAEAALAAAINGVGSPSGGSVGSAMAGSASSPSFAMPSALHSSMPRDASSPVFTNRARTMSPQRTDFASQRSIFQNNNVSPTGSSLASPAAGRVMLSTEHSPTLAMRLSTPSPQGGGGMVRQQQQQLQQRRSQLPPLVELDLRARGAGVNAVRQQRGPPTVGKAS